MAWLPFPSADALKGHRCTLAFLEQCVQGGTPILCGMTLTMGQSVSRRTPQNGSGPRYSGMRWRISTAPRGLKLNAIGGPGIWCGGNKAPAQEGRPMKAWYCKPCRLRNAGMRAFCRGCGKTRPPMGEEGPGPKGGQAMAHAEWHRCTICHAPWLGQFTKHAPSCPSYVDLTPKDYRIFRGKPSEFFEQAARQAGIPAQGEQALRG